MPPISGAVDLVISDKPQAFVVLQLEGETGTRVLELPDAVDVTIGQDARITRRGATIELEDLPSRIATYVNGERVMGKREIRAGDAIAIGPLVAIAGLSHARLPKRPKIDSLITQVLGPRPAAPATTTPTEPPVRPTPPPLGDMRTQLGEIERATIVAALDAAGGNQTQAARTLGMSRRTLIYRMEKYGLKAAPDREDGDDD